MALTKPPAAVARKRGVDLVIDETSESYAFIDRASREGRRVATRDLSDDAVRAMLLGNPKGG